MRRTGGRYCISEECSNPGHLGGISCVRRAQRRVCDAPGVVRAAGWGCGGLGAAREPSRRARVNRSTFAAPSSSSAPSLSSLE